MAIPAASSVDSLTRVITLVSLAIGVFATWKALPMDAEIKRLEAETQRLDLALKKADAELRTIESSRKVTLELYQEVKKVIANKEKDPREEDAVRVLVEALAEDPFRWKLLRVIAVGAGSKEVKETAAANSRFYEDQAVVQSATIAPPNPAPASVKSGEIGAYNIDIFFCESKRATSEPIARTALELKPAAGKGRWRVRALPESINQQPGYGVVESEIRYTPPDEKPIANSFAKLLSSKDIKFKFRETSYPTPGYISAFVCQ
jgi:hypothetical protein